MLQPAAIKHTAAGLFCLAACCALLLAAFPAHAAISPDALNGTWRIDFEATLAVNEDWQRTYEGYGAEARVTMQRSLGARELTLDLKNMTMKDRTDTGKERSYAVSEIHNHEGGLRMTVTPENSSSYFVDIALQNRDVMRLVIDEREPIILKRK